MPQPRKRREETPSNLAELKGLSGTAAMGTMLRYWSLKKLQRLGHFLVNAALAPMYG